MSKANLFTRDDFDEDYAVGDAFTAYPVTIRQWGFCLLQFSAIDWVMIEETGPGKIEVTLKFDKSIEVHQRERAMLALKKMAEEYGLPQTRSITWTFRQWTNQLEELR